MEHICYRINKNYRETNLKGKIAVSWAHTHEVARLGEGKFNWGGGTFYVMPGPKINVAKVDILMQQRVVAYFRNGAVIGINGAHVPINGPVNNERFPFWMQTKGEPSSTNAEPTSTSTSTSTSSSSPRYCFCLSDFLCTVPTRPWLIFTQWPWE